MAQHPNLHDALNDYLDAFIGPQPLTRSAADLDPDLRADVDAFFDLARRAGAGPTPRSTSMYTSTTTELPVRPAVSPPSQSGASRRAGAPGRGVNTWISAAIVSLMLLGIVGGAWWFGPGQGNQPGEEPFRLAALTEDESTPQAIWPEPLTPEEAPWIASISPDECTVEALPFSAYAEAKTTDPGPPAGSWEIVGVPEPDDAQAVVSVLRGWLACGDAGDTSRVRTFYTPEFLFFSDISIDNAPYQEELAQRQAEVQRQWTIWARDIGLFPNAVVAGVEPPEVAVEIFEFAQAVLDGEETLVDLVQTPITYIEPRYDPADAVLMADERIMIPTRYVYWAEDPWAQHHGFSPEPNMQTRAIVLKKVDGLWKIDDSSVWICIGECDALFVETPATPVATPQD